MSTRGPVDTGIGPEVPPLGASRRRGVVALGFVVLSLLLLLLVPFLLERRIEGLRREIADIARPARLLMIQMELTTAWQAAALRAYAASGDPRFLQMYVRAREDETRVFALLGPLIRRLGASPTTLFLEVRELTPRWHAGPDAVLRGQLLPRDFRERLPEQDSLYRSLNAAVVRLDREISRRIIQRTATMRRLQRQGLAITALLVAFALASAVVVARLVRAQRRLVVRLGRSARQEYTLRRAARDLTESVAVADLLRRVVVHATETADAAFVERLDPEREEVEIAASEGAEAPPLGVRVPYADSLTAELGGRGDDGVVEARVAADTPGMAHVAERCIGCSALILALSSEGHALGSLVLLRSPGRPAFRADDVAWGRAIGDLTALALRRILLYREAEHRRDVAVELARELSGQIESKSRVMRGISHDVKNPLGAALGYTHLLEDGIYGTLAPVQRNSVQRVRALVETALALIDDVLSLARSESGSLAISPCVLEPAAVLHEAVEAHRAAAERAGHTIELRLPDSLPPVETDPVRLQQVLGNLISNAIKYVPAGGTISVHADPTRGRRSLDPPQWLSIHVRDDGPGIPVDDQCRVFEEFTRLAPHAGPGSGLGLAISQRIARLLGGEITLESTPGAGCTFTLRLPLAEVPGGAAPEDA